MHNLSINTHTKKKKISDFQSIIYICRHKTYSIFVSDWNLKSTIITVGQGREVLGKHDVNFGSIMKMGWCGTVHQTPPFQTQNSVNMDHNQQRGLNMNFAEEAAMSHINCRLQGMWSIFISKYWLLLVFLQVPGADVKHKGSRGKWKWLKIGVPWSFSIQTEWLN